MFLLFFFYLPIVLLLHSYIIYPLSIFIFSKYFKKNYSTDAIYTPNISIIISAFNEEKVIEKTIRNFFSLDYDSDKIEIIIGSDKSEDNTNAIIEKLMFEFPQIKFYPFSVRRGKSQVLNDLVEKSSNDILILSDANTMYYKDSIKNLVKFYKDDRVGGVSGKLILLKSKEATHAAASEKSYWDFETALKEKEGELGMLIGANGGIYSIRKKYFEKIPTNYPVMDDFFVSLKVFEKNKLFLYTEEAKAEEFIAPNWKIEFNRKIRNNSIMMSTIKAIKELLKPKYGIIAYGLWSHKIIRWFTPVLLLVLFIANIFLVNINNFYLGIFAAQLSFYGISLLGYFLEKNNIYNKVSLLCFYFTMTNIAMFIGIFKFISKKQTSFWQSTARLNE